MKSEGLDNIFKIGHTNDSETFLPSFYKPPGQPFMYCDIAGLLDTGGTAMRIVNCFMAKKIFSMAKSVRFLVPITQAQLEEAKGGPIIEHIDTINRMCANSLEDIGSIQPVLTKVQACDDGEFDIDSIK